MEALKKALKDLPILFSFLKLLYRRIVIPVMSGYFPLYFLYCLFVQKREVGKISSMGFTDVNKFLPDTWRYGKGKDKAFRRYYTAWKNGKKYFVKIATKNDSSVQNEIEIQMVLSQKKYRWTPACIIANKDFCDDKSILAVEYEEGLRRFQLPSTEKEFDMICAKYVEILDELNTARLVHSDIHAGNLMMDEMNNLHLLDFGISRFIDKTNEVDYLARPGTFYQTIGKVRRYDDAYSFVSLMDKLKLPEQWENVHFYGEIEKRINRCYSDVLVGQKQ